MVYVCILTGIFFIDFYMKKYIEKNKKLHHEEKILNGKIILRKYHNKGAMLNFFEDKQPIVLIISFLAFVGLAVFFFISLLKRGNELLKLGLSFMLGGALSNLYDRLTRKYVVDYFSFQSKWTSLKKIIFNLSDLFIFLGGFLIMIASFFRAVLSE